MFYTVYKITNKVNGKFYIGCHKTEVLDDGYMGSGTILKRAIKKHGLENFSKEILHVYDTAEEMFTKEKELVYVSEETYNLKQGGSGGFDHIDNSGEKNPFYGKHHTDSVKSRVSQSLKTFYANNPDVPLGRNRWSEEASLKWKGKPTAPGKPHTEEAKRAISEKNKGRVPWNKGIPRSEEDKKKISQAMKKK